MCAAGDGAAADGSATARWRGRNGLARGLCVADTSGHVARVVDLERHDLDTYAGRIVGWKD